MMFFVRNETKIIHIILSPKHNSNEKVLNIIVDFVDRHKELLNITKNFVEMPQ